MNECIYNNYLLNHDKLNKIIVYNFNIYDGGIGDLIKYFITLLEICVKNNIKIYYLENNILINNFLKMKHIKLNITLDEIVNPIYNKNILDDLSSIEPNKFYMITPRYLYSYYNESVLTNIKDVFAFTDEIKNKYNNFITNVINGEKYISIHLRLGDKYLETDKSYIQRINNVRKYNLNNIYNFIENNKDKIIIFFCDNNSFKLKIKEKYNFIIITDYEIGHTSLTNTTYTQTLDAVTEFYLVSNSEHIYSASYSGFSIVASKFNNIPLTNL